jgi:hypothetical protein
MRKGVRSLKTESAPDPFIGIREAVPLVPGAAVLTVDDPPGVNGIQVSKVGSSWGLRPGPRDGRGSGSGSLSAKVG